MKIYEIATGYTPVPAQMGAATEIVVEELTRAFLKMGENVEIIDISADQRADTDLPITEVKVPSVFTKSDVSLGIMHKVKRVVYSVALAFKLKKILKSEKEKVVLHFHNQYNMFFFLKLVPKKLRQKATTAYTNHSGIWRLNWSDVEDTLKHRYFQEAVCMKKADIVFVLNQETKDNIITYLNVDKKRVLCIENGVNCDIYKPLNPEEKVQAKYHYGISGKKLVLQVGSVYENKGQLRSLKYLLPLLQKDKNLIYGFVGGIVDNEYYNQVIELATTKGVGDQVKYFGMVSPGKELNQLYNAATATIIASRYEAHILVVNESLSSGIPVLIEKESPYSVGDGCIAYDYLNANETFENEIENVTNYLTHCTKARQNATNNYSWQKIANDYIENF